MMPTDTTIADKNIQISKFMGFTYYDHGLTPCVVDHLKNGIPVSELKYHSDWNLLYDTYVKIRVWYGENYNGDKDQQDMKRLFSVIQTHLLYSNIETTHHAVYDFILWYNTQ